MRILKSSQWRIHHRNRRQSLSSQRITILAFSPLEVHDDKGDTGIKRQRDNRHRGRNRANSEQGTDDGHHDKPFQKFGTEVINRPVDELAAT